MNTKWRKLGSLGAVWALAANSAFALLFLNRANSQDLGFLSTPFFLGIYLLVGLGYGFLSGATYLALHLFLARKAGVSAGIPKYKVVLFAQGAFVVVSTFGLATISQAFTYREPILFLGSFLISALAVWFSLKVAQVVPNATTEVRDPSRVRSQRLYVVSWLLGVFAAATYGQIGNVSAAANGPLVWLMTLALLYCVYSPFGVILGVAFFHAQSFVEKADTRITSNVLRKSTRGMVAVCQILIGCLVLTFVGQKWDGSNLVGVTVNALLAAFAWSVTFGKTRPLAKQSA